MFETNIILGKVFPCIAWVSNELNKLLYPFNVNQNISLYQKNIILIQK